MEFEISGKTLKSYLGMEPKVAIPDNVTEIAPFAFCGNSQIRRVVIPKTVTHIGEGAFSDCINLEEVIYEEGTPIDVIEENTFFCCRQLLKVVIHGTAEQLTVKPGAFSNVKVSLGIFFPGKVRKTGPVDYSDDGTYFCRAFSSEDDYQCYEENYTGIFGTEDGFDYAVLDRDGERFSFVIGSVEEKERSFSVPERLGGYPVRAINLYGYLKKEHIIRIPKTAQNDLSFDSELICHCCEDGTADGVLRSDGVEYCKDGIRYLLFEDNGTKKAVLSGFDPNAETVTIPASFDGAEVVLEKAKYPFDIGWRFRRSQNYVFLRKDGTVAGTVIDGLVCFPANEVPDIFRESRKPYPVVEGCIGEQVIERNGFRFLIAQQNSRREAIVIGRTRTDANLVLPSEVDGIEVTRIFRVDCTAENRPCHVRRIVIPRTVKCIDSGAFHYKCNFGANLHELFIPASVEKLGTRIIDDGEHYRKFPADDDEFFTFLCEAPSQPTGWAEDWNCYDDYDSKEHCYSVIFGATI